ncbi:hypothetical protein SAMN04487906_0093 [Zhouia amylolytica]|uniref:Rhodanese domain-containing protein n=1 Tax=Zhouia amylolytica TaxID=376730 RepID=A0A1I6P303_9FLAO|nr:hypothetical protein [Zhouia amylolytica]MCQ0111729.1 rhodanese-like domain-containing protein [Zhouia amylolytica]SFS34584.1 hypothetical protein SAMN04487906_0093 [Zhouia amylolytica]
MMIKTRIVFWVFGVLMISFLTGCSENHKANSEPWAEPQLIQPSELAGIIEKGNTSDVYLYSIGPAGPIKGSVEFGPAQQSDNLKQLEKRLNELPKDADVVLYCGCCPFKDCPNIRPAFTLLNEMGFTRHKLLNLSQNLKVDWIDKGYPLMD